MAISRAEVIATLTTREEETFKEIETQIDDELRTFDGSSKLINCSHMSPRIIKRVEQTYTRADLGWKVTVVYGDQREPGTWLNFS